MSGFIASIEDPSQIAEARRSVRRLAAGLDFGEQATEQAAIVVTEACTNLLKHATTGQIVARQVSVPATRAGAAEAALLEILALDRGPGIGDVAGCLRDGHSTGGTLGTGLGAIGRLSAYMEIYSRPGRGTVVLARVSDHGPAVPGPVRTGAIQSPKPGEQECGDQWGVAGVNGERTFLLADGLGHGPDAARASGTAVATLYRHPDLSLTDLLSAVHDALRPTRGAAVAIARIDAARGIITYAGLGNISGTVFSAGAPRRMVSTNGTAGMEARHIRDFTYPWTEDATLILHSDGIGTRWDLSDYPGLAGHDPAVIAGVIYRDFCRGHDDATVVVAK